MKVLKTLFITAALLVGSAASNASIILSTGVDGSGNLVTAGNVDSFWDISLDGGATWADAVVAYPIQICCGMATVSNSAAWVTDPSVVSDSINTGWGVNNLVLLTRTFDLTGYDLSTVALSGIMRIADYTRGVYINGTLIPGSDTGGTATWGIDRVLAANSSFFTSGTNTITLRGQSGNSTWDAFYLNASVTGVKVPEPSTLAILALGMIGLGARRFKR